MFFRPATVEDASQLAEIHYLCRDRLPQSFMIELGVVFLTAYYRIILREKMTVILCAAAPANHILGFVSGTADATIEARVIRRAMFGLGAAALLKLISKPTLGLKLIHRFKRPKAGANSFFIHPYGARVAFWGWRPDLSSGPNAIRLFQQWMKTMDGLGVDQVYGEVDADNSKLLRIHEVLGASRVRSYFTPEGRERILIVYPLSGKAGPQNAAPNRNDHS